MLRIGFLIGLLLFGMNLVAQDFPTSWEGKWVGEVQVLGPVGQQQAFPMSLEIKAVEDHWAYTFFYGHGHFDEPDIREYSLVVLNDSLGHYAIDEQNDIMLGLLHG